MRILIAISAPISVDAGAGQVAINIVEVLRNQGHEVVLWTSHPCRAWHFLKFFEKKAKMDQFLKTQQAFDIISTNPELVTKRTCRLAGKIVSCNPQPFILYGIYDYKPKDTKNVLKKSAHFLLYWFDVLFHSATVVLAWKRSSHILCLGSLELKWMNKHFPFWKNKMSCYLPGTSAEERLMFSNIRRQRKDTIRKEGIQFLWVGRWTQHKGTDILLDFIRKRAALYPQDSFTIAGCGNWAEKDCPEELLKTEKLRIIPFFDRKKLYSILAGHDVGLFTSKIEGWGLCLNEMLESGMPVFATHAGGVPDLQPYFKETLKPFPPPQTLTADTLPTSDLDSEYYKIFDWGNITKIYETLG